jgi:hypothetical protein
MQRQGGKERKNKRKEKITGPNDFTDKENTNYKNWRLFNLCKASKCTIFISRISPFYVPNSHTSASPGNSNTTAS